jgi:ATP-dependent helicase/nuclease subunit B
MHEEIFRALDAGGTIITASRRLTRVLAREFHSRKAESGARVWNRPDVLPFDAYLDRGWREWLAAYADGNTPVLLGAAQEQALWERIIRDSPSGASLLRVPETALQAIETWALAVEYRLPVDGRFDATEDWSAFARWSREFERQCKRNRWMERARLADFLRTFVKPGVVYIAGFDEMTPQQTDFFGASGDWRVVEMPDYSPILERRRVPDASDEIRAAAAWARTLLAEDPETQIGIVVVPDLSRSRAKVGRILAQALEPRLEWTDRERAFHLSIGPALGEYPLVRAAILMLEFAQGDLTLPRAGMLMRSPFAGGSEKESGKRAQLDARLRRKGIWELSIARLIDEAGDCPELQRVLKRVEKLFRKIPGTQKPSDWARDLEDLLDAFRWPGDRALSSGEFQTMGAWRGVLSDLASLDLTQAQMNLPQALDWLRAQTASARFQVEDEDAPIQVMGMLEASGLRFDHLWIMGLHDEALPAPAHANPFLPTALQREHDLPHSSAERELSFATKLVERLLRSAPDVVLSYPEAEGDRVLSPSALVDEGVWARQEESPVARFAPLFDEIADEVAPRFVQSDSTGGASLFKDMAACPFRAFAKHRLGAKPLESSDLGLSYSDRGTTVHKALEFIWRNLGSHARLIDLSSPELGSLIAQGAEEAVAKLGPGIGRDLEKQRLEKLLTEWLNIEKQRVDFTVVHIEDKRIAEIGGLRVEIRADRVDALPDGREIILDYKTGQLKADAWLGERPGEPQLPLYSVTNPNPIAGAAFAAIRTGELRFRGLIGDDVALPEFKELQSNVPFEALTLEWNSVLAKLAGDFRAGTAAVDPKKGACDNCGLRALCRVRELENDRG